jgi:hypothetical protein
VKLDSYPFRWQWDRKRYPAPWLCTRPTEDAVEQQILALLAAKYVRAWKTDAAAKVLRGRARGALHRAGASREDMKIVFAGQAGAVGTGKSDITGVMPGGRALFIEVKQPEWLEPNRATGQLIQVKGRNAGTPTDDQLKFLMDMHQQGALVTVAWSTEDVEQLIAESLKLQR